MDLMSPGTPAAIPPTPMTDEAPTTPRVSIKHGATGTPEQISQSRSSSWTPTGPEGAKRWKPAGMIGALVEAALRFHEKEIEDDELAIIGAMTDDFMTPDVSDARRLEHRIDEISKVDQFDGFVAVPRTDAGESRVYDHRWVDTRDKSRITCKDLKRFAIDPDEQIHSPTPTDWANNLFD